MSGNSGRPSAAPTPPTGPSVPLPDPTTTTEPSDRLSRALQDIQTPPNSTSHTRDLIRAIHRFNNSRLDATPNGAAHPNPNRSNTEAIPTDVPSVVRQELQGLHDTVALLARNSSLSATSPSNTAQLSRSRARTTSERRRYLERRRNRLSAMNTDSLDPLSASADLHHASIQLENASYHMRALLDDSQNILANPDLAADEYSGEAETNRAIKRRKIDAGVSILGFQGFSYGYHGQVEPGKLKMEIESCDGGTLEGYGTNTTCYTAANVLKNDNSVYCTKGNRCNLILRHQGATPFALTELSIKGPPRDYTDPVQEGMVFVSMEHDEALIRTAQYQIQYSAPRHRVRLASRDPNNSHIISIRHHPDGTPIGHENRSSTGSGLEAGSEEWECRLAQLPLDFTNRNPSPFNVNIECDDSDSEIHNPPRRRRAADRLSGRLSGMLSGNYDPASDSDESSDRDHRWAEEAYLLGVAGPRPSGSGHPSVSQPRLIHRIPQQQPNVSDDLAEAVLAAQEATHEAVKAVGSVSFAAGGASTTTGLMAPLAWFFIEREKSKCTIHFDPPVSGRFILLKMWSPHFSEAANIDIQSVVAKGFAGPRSFPATQLQ